MPWNCLYAINVVELKFLSTLLGVKLSMGYLINNPLIAFVECSETERRCTNGLCLGLDYWCNGMDDCQDESDETDPICNSGKYDNMCLLG